VTTRQRISSGGRWEAAVGYSRAFVVGDACHVSGTTDAGLDGRARHPGDAGAQARAAWATIEKALDEAAFTFADVVRTRMFVVRREDIDAVLRVHGELFGEIRPAATIVTVSGLIDDSLLVEIEADAVR
jgi:enamine deaminase RidA (YjgF/YER057c/UK114 family)